MKSSFNSTKKIFTLLGLMLCFGSLFAQVKIGDNPTAINSNSLLEMESSDKGFLIPRVTLNDASTEAPLSSPVPDGMMIYNTGGSEEQGLYYWDSNEWQQVLSGPNANTRDNHVIVKSISDLPTPSGGVITLNAANTYEINGTMLLADQIDLNEATIYGLDVNEDKLVYTGSSGALFTGNEGGTIKTLTLVASGGSSKLFDLEDLSATKTIVFRDCIVANTQNVGNIKGYNLVFASVINFSGNSNGITYEDITSLLLENIAWFANNSNTFETYVGTFSTIEKLGGFAEPDSVNSATALDVSGVVSVSTGVIKNSVFQGTGTYVSGTFSKQWEVKSTGITTETDDVAAGNIYLTTPVKTNIPAMNTYYKANGITTAANLFRFTSTVDNRLTYDGTKTRKFDVTAIMSLDADSRNRVFTVAIAKNGTVLTETEQTSKLGSKDDVRNLAIDGVVTLAPGDYIEVWLKNIVTTHDIELKHLNLSIN